jgi:hypothetical protein
MRIGANLDWTIVPGFGAGLRFNMSNAKSDLTQGMWIEPMAIPVEYKNDDMTIAAVFTYALDENTTFRLLGENRNREMSIPMTWTRGQKLPPIFGLDPNAPPRYQTEVDSASVMIGDTANDIYIDFGVNTRLAEQLSVGLGFSYLAVTGNVGTTPQVVNYNGTPTRNGDVTRMGGPFNRMTISGNIGYDISSRFGVMLDVFYAAQDEEAIDPTVPAGTPAVVSYYGLNDYSGLGAALNVVYNF